MGAQEETKGHQSDIPKPQERKGPKEPPYTGWDDEVPSKDGGDSEKDWLHKPPYNWSSDKFKADWHASCFCGNLEFEFVGKPWASKFCHCKTCQRIHGAPFQHAVIFPKTSVRMVKNENNALDFYSTEKHNSEHYVPCKIHCRNCTSNMFDEGRATVLAYPSSFNFPDGKMPNDFQSQAHIFYGSRSMDVPDGLPKWEGHMEHSKLMEEHTDDPSIMPKYKSVQEKQVSKQKGSKKIDDEGPQETNGTNGNDEGDSGEKKAKRTKR